MKEIDTIVETYSQLVKSGELSWEQATTKFNEQTGLELNTVALKKRASRLLNKPIEEEPSEFKKEKKLFPNGEIEEFNLLELTNEETDSPEAFLKAVNRNPLNWELVTCSHSIWQQHTKLQTTKQLYAVRWKIKPVQNSIDLDFIIKELNKSAKNIIPLKVEKSSKNKSLNDDKLLEQTPVELHLGELSCKMNTGENYDYKIASDRYRNIVKETCELQLNEQCGTLLLSVGGDFFNSDNNADTTTKGTQQHSDIRGNKMFLVGSELWIEAIKTYEPLFNEIDIQFVPGNHDSDNSFKLFTLLRFTFLGNSKIHFIEDYKPIQCYEFGKCMIATTHGSKNINRTMDKLVSDFKEIYGRTIYRELHTGHLHSEMELKERIGIIPRRLSTVKGHGEWENEEMYGNSVKKQMEFIWNRNTGVESIKMIPFERELDLKQNVKVKRK